MTLEADQAKWIFKFTGGKVRPEGAVSGKGAAETLKDELQIIQAREFAEEQALKEQLLDAAVGRIEVHKERIRETQAFSVTTQGEGLFARKKKEQTRDKKGRQERAFEAADAKKVTAIDGIDISDARAQEKLMSAANAMEPLRLEKDKLAAMTTMRSFVNTSAEPPAIEQREELLFSDAEIMKEVYTPLVRELVLAETFVPPKYSATQSMIDGSDEYYVNECRERGKQVGLGVAELGKGAVQLASSVTGTVLSALAPVEAGQHAMGASGKLSKQMAARASDITTGIATLLTGTIDVVDVVSDKVRNKTDFPDGVFATMLDTVGNGIGKVVAGSTGNDDLGSAITAAVGAGARAGKLAKAVVDWRRLPPNNEPPWEAMIDAVGGVISSSLSAKAAQVEGPASKPWTDAADLVSLSFKTIASGSKKNLITAMRNGQWQTCFDVLEDSAAEATKIIPGLVQFNKQATETEGYDNKKDLAEALETFKAGADGAAPSAEELLALLGEKAGKKIPMVPAEKMSARMQKLFDDKQKAINKERERIELNSMNKIEERLAAEKQSYKDALVCLGSDNPDDSQYKSIAKLIAQLEHDRKIWDGMMMLFGSGIGAASGLGAAMSVAAEVAAPLKAAGQLIKFITNLKAAADRLEAFLEWKDAQTDAVSAVSPYATSVDNFVKNQGTQFTHYTLQASANAIQALLACGEMSPYAPAFKVAGAGVAAAAAAEQLVYTFYKKAALAKAWKQTREALDPKNKGNRKMALLARQMNPTLAKFTIAYGGLIAKDPIAITALNRIGLDRETLARAKDKVGEVQKYMEKLYSDDGSLVGILPIGAPVGRVKVPEPALTVKAWSLSIALWQKNEGLQGDSPPLILGSLTIVERLSATMGEDPEEASVDKLVAALLKLTTALRAFKPVDAKSEPCAPAVTFAGLYADLAESRAQAITFERGAANKIEPVQLAA